MAMDGRKRPYNSLKRNGECREPTEEKKKRKLTAEEVAAGGSHGCISIASDHGCCIYHHSVIYRQILEHHNPITS